MADSIVHAVEDLSSTPWVYFALFGIAMLDAFFPVVPSESLVITLGAFAGSTGEPELALVMVFAALGALAGDHISYAIGRTAGARVFAKLKPHSKTKRTYDRVGRMLDERGGLVIVVARYIPGGRTAATLTTGATGFPRPSFTRFAVIAAVTWAIYSAGLGYVGGVAFEREPLKGVVLGLGLAIGITAAHEAIRASRLRRRDARSRITEGAEAEEPNR